MKYNLLKVTIQIVLGILIAGLLNACGDKSTPTNNTESPSLRIGAMLPLTGDNASYGVDCRKGMELALEEYNASHQSKANIVFEDTKADPKVAVSAINKLIDVDSVSIILGDMFSSTTIAAAPIAQEKGIVLITPTAAMEKIPETGDHIFSIYPTSKFEGEFVAEFANKRGMKKFGVLMQQVQVAEEIGQSFIDKAKKMNGEIVYSEVVPSSTTGYRSVIEKHKRDAVDGIFISAYRDEAGTLIKQAREAGYKTQFLSQSSLYDGKTISQFGNAVEGVIFSAPFFNDDVQSAIVNAFRNGYKAKYESMPNVWAAYGYDVTNLALQGASDSDKLKSPLHIVLAKSKFDGVTGNMSFFANRTANKTMQMFQITQNKFAPLDQ